MTVYLTIPYSGRGSKRRLRKGASTARANILKIRNGQLSLKWKLMFVQLFFCFSCNSWLFVENCQIGLTLLGVDIYLALPFSHKKRIHAEQSRWDSPPVILNVSLLGILAFSFVAYGQIVPGSRLIACHQKLHMSQCSCSYHMYGYRKAARVTLQLQLLAAIVF